MPLLFLSSCLKNVTWHIASSTHSHAHDDSSSTTSIPTRNCFANEVSEPEPEEMRRQNWKQRRRQRHRTQRTESAINSLKTPTHSLNYGASAKPTSNCHEYENVSHPKLNELITLHSSSMNSRVSKYFTKDIPVL